jgi:two-component system, OmpR family, sensor histidine kinase KdpD
MPISQRPDPDRLLAAVQLENTRAQRGRLRIFFGASAGVGKTYAMLQAAHAVRERGIDVVVGYVEPHGRSATEQLLDGLERLPLIKIQYRDIIKHEFNLDAALQRAARITLIDELAHSNLLDGEPRPRHPKRWQDITEMLDAGLDIWTTVNVQHLESLNDVIAGITGIRQRETVPDRVFDEAAEVELIDLPPDDLLERLQDGKIYGTAQIDTALQRFFRKTNLIALRELALRRTADRVDATVRELADLDNTSHPTLARDRFLVAVAPDEQAEALVRFGKRFADALDAEWTVVAVETPALQRLSAARRDQRIAVLRLAESLGAETVTLDGPSVVRTLIEYACLRNATRIVVGEAPRKNWWSYLQPATGVELIRLAQGIDVSVIARRNLTTQKPRSDTGKDFFTPVQDTSVPWTRYAAALLISAAATLLAKLLSPLFADTNVVMIFLLGAALSGLKLGRGPAVLTTVVNVACFNFFFVHPTYTFAVADAQYLVTFAVMLIVALIIATLMASVRQQTRVAGARERRTALLYGMSRELTTAQDLDTICKISIQHVATTFAAEVVLLKPGTDERSLVTVLPVTGTHLKVDSSIAQWVFDNSRPAGLGTHTLPGTAALYLPLTGAIRTVGVLTILPKNPRRVLLPEQRHLLETFTSQIALAIERVALTASAERARLNAETETLRNTLLSSISHDLRTPLSIISGASSALSDPQLLLDSQHRQVLINSIAIKAKEMSQLISDVLDLMRFESSTFTLRRDWQTLDDLTGLARSRLSSLLDQHEVRVSIAEDFPAVYVDAVLFTQLLVNLLENAAKHTPTGSYIEIRGTNDQNWIRLFIDDNGPGLPPGNPERLFVKFERGRNESDTAGAGLGLAICQAIAKAHGGEIFARNRPEGGASFVVEIPAREFTA